MNKEFVMPNQLNVIYKLTMFALPISASALINMATSFIAMFFLARLGEVELAAAALAVPTFITITMVIPTFYAVGILISHARGEGKSPVEIGQIVKNGWWLAIVLTLPSTILLWNASDILLSFKQNPQLVELTKQYFHYAALSMLPTLIDVVIIQFYTGIGYPRFNMIVSLIAMPLIILISYGLILGKLGLPQIGLAGISCSVFIVQLFICIAILIFMFFNHEIKKYQIFSGKYLPDINLVKAIFILGFPICLQFIGELAAMTLNTYFMGYFGVAPLAAAQISSQYGMLVIMVFLGLSQAVSILTSEAYGQKDRELIKAYIKSSIIILSTVIILVIILFLVFPKYLINVFINNNNLMTHEIIHYAIIFMTIMIVTLYADGVRNLLSGGLRGLHDSKAPMMIGISSLWLISIPLSYIVAFHFHGGPISLRFTFMIGFVVAVIFLARRIKYKLNNLSVVKANVL